MRLSEVLAVVVGVMMGLLVVILFVMSEMHMPHKTPAPISRFERRSGTRKQRALRSLIPRAAKAFDDHGIQYFIGFGTLLGAYRDGDVIKGDGDVDMCIPREYAGGVRTIDWNKYGMALGCLKRCSHQRMREMPGWMIRSKDKMSKLTVDEELDAITYYRLFNGADGYIDVYILDLEDGRYHTRTPADFCKSFAVDDVFPRKEVWLDDVRVWAPGNPRKVLEELYGSVLFESKGGMANTILS